MPTERLHWMKKTLPVFAVVLTLAGSCLASDVEDLAVDLSLIHI